MSAPAASAPRPTQGYIDFMVALANYAPEIAGTLSPAFPNQMTSFRRDSNGHFQADFDRNYQVTMRGGDLFGRQLSGCSLLFNQTLQGTIQNGQLTLDRGSIRYRTSDGYTGSLEQVRVIQNDLSVTARVGVGWFKGSVTRQASFADISLILHSHRPEIGSAAASASAPTTARAPDPSVPPPVAPALSDVVQAIAPAAPGPLAPPARPIVSPTPIVRS